MSGVRFAPVAALLLALAVHGNDMTNDYVFTKDYDTARNAKSAIGLYCAADGWTGERPDRPEMRVKLLAEAGGSDMLGDALKASSSQDEFSTKLGEQITPKSMLFKAGPLVMFFLLVIAWFICCWTAWPWKFCCRCCRVCKRERETSKIVKFVLLVAVLLVGFVVVIAGITASGGFGQAVEGFDNMACTSAKLLDATLNGTASPPFIGMMPLLNEFDTLEKQLNDGSPFMTQLLTIMDSTAPIVTSLGVASNTIDLLKDMMANADNNAPKDSSGNSLHHECRMCTALVAPLQQVVDTLTGGLGQKLGNARQEVDRQLTPSMRADLQSVIKVTVEPLKGVKDSVRDTFGIFADTDKFLAMKDLFDGPGSPMFLFFLLLILMALGVWACGGISTGCFVWREKPSKYRMEQGNKNPYNKGVHRCACLTWCCAYLYCVLAFLMGGIFQALTIPMTSMCLIMDGLSGDLVRDIGPGVGLNISGDLGDMMVGMIDECFAPSNASSTGYLLDILYVRENGTKVTMRTRVVDQVKTQISAQFDAIGSGASPTIANSTSVVSLVGVFQNNPIDAMILPMSSSDYDWANDATIKDMFADPRDQAGLNGVLVSGARCADHTVVGLDAGGLTSVTGVTEIADRLSYFGPLQAYPMWPCAQKSDCSNATDATEAAACVGGNNFMELKRKVKLATYRCDLFVRPVAGGPCDPLLMVQNPVTLAWSGDCVAADGTMTRLPVTCTLDQFVLYTQQYAQRITKVMGRIDSTVAQVQTGINTDLRGIVSQYIIDPLEFIANSDTCGFLGGFYREMIDGLCFQAVMAFTTITKAYIACAVLMLLLLIIQYAIWRRSVDNYNSWSKNAVREVNVDQNAPLS